MCKDALGFIHILATAILAGQLKDICYRILLEVQR